MKNANILIANPFQLHFAKDISVTINRETHYHTCCIENLETLNGLQIQDIKLIFICLQTSCRDEKSTVIERFLKRFSPLPVIGVLKCDGGNTVNSLLKKYVWNIIAVPFTRDDIILNIWKYLPAKQANNFSIQQKVKQNFGFSLLKGCSEQIIALKEKIARVAPYNVSVLIKGETGAGKELCAKMVHFLSPRSKKPFVPINCGAIPKDLFENELFGHIKGAYTHANESQVGLIQSANGGTLFLDEIESMPLSMQVKLLRFLEEKKYKPLGQAKYASADVRIIAAAKENLWQSVQEKNFRQDLFYRLKVVQLKITPLRERREDIPILVESFVKRYATLYNKEIRGIAPSAMLMLMHDQWPGNVRELENVIQGLVIMNATGWIEMADINLKTSSSRGNSAIRSFKQGKQRAIEHFEKKYLEDVMLISHGNISQSARVAQKERSAFCRLLKKYDLRSESYRL